MIRRLFACVVLLGFAAFATAQPAPKDAKDSAFKVHIDATLTMDVAGQQVKVVADTEFQYTWRSEAKSKTLLMDLMLVKAEAAGMEMMNVRMSRAGFFDKKSGNEVKLEDAPAQLKTLLTDSFGSPLCKIELDAAGNETKRTITAGPGAKVLIDTGMIANATLFHPPYMADKDEWKADLDISAGKGLASGKVTYTKIPGGKGGQLVKVSGTLTADGVKSDNNLIIKEGKYVVTGEQLYDTTRKEWVSGKMDLDVSFKLSDGTKVVGSAKGPMKVTFELLPAKK